MRCHSTSGRRVTAATVTLALAVVAAACGSTPSPAPASAIPSPAAVVSPSATVATPSATPSATASPTAAPSASASPSPSAPAADPLLGTDGRFTVLLLGSDYRPSAPGNRTDAIMVVSLNPATGQVGAFSVPRDTAVFPLPEGGTFNGKINALYQWYQHRNGHGLASFKKAMAEAYGIEIDYGVLTTFAGVRELVNAVGGVTVTLAKSYYDPAYWVNNHTQGWGLSAGTHKLMGETALIFARSRKGDSDFKRAGRQQQLVQAAATKALAKGSGILPKLLAIAARTTTTDLPLARALDIYSLVATAQIAKAKTKVFGPTKYATHASGTNYKPNLAACRAWIKANFPPASPGAVWPPKT